MKIAVVVNMVSVGVKRLLLERLRSWYIKVAGEDKGLEGGDSEAFMKITFSIASFKRNKEIYCTR
jgi:hypothetical protein